MRKLKLWLAIFPAINVRGYFWGSSATDVRVVILKHTGFNAYLEHGEITLARKVG